MVASEVKAEEQQETVDEQKPELVETKEIQPGPDGDVKTTPAIEKLDLTEADPPKPVDEPVPSVSGTDAVKTEDAAVAEAKPLESAEPKLSAAEVEAKIKPDEKPAEVKPKEKTELTKVDFAKEAKNRVKLYVLCDQKVWDDRGTGHVTCVTSPEQPNASFIVVQLETAGQKKNVLESRILQETAYQKQQETLIVWSESENCDLALSFQEKTGCEEIWAKICEVQGRDPDDGYDDIDEEASDPGQHNPTLMTARTNTIALPPCEMSRLGEIELLLSNNLQTPAIRDRMANTIELEEYIPKLCDVFRMCEDVENLDGLHQMFNIVRHLFHLNRNSIIDRLFAKEHLREVLGMLEYDQSKEEPRKHREFIFEKTHFKNILNIEQEDLKDKIRHAYVVQYVQDVCFPAPSIFEENLLTVLNSHLFFHRVEIVSLLMEERVLRSLFTELKDEACTVARRAELVKFLRELCSFSQALTNSGPNSREAFFKTLMHNDVLATIEPSLKSPHVETRNTIVEVLGMLVEFSPHTIREHIISQAKNSTDENVLLNLLICHMLNDRDAELSSAEQVFQALRTIIDPDNMGANKTERGEFLVFFYRRCINTVVKKLFENVEGGKLVKDDYYTASVSHMVVRLLCFCVEHHAFNVRQWALGVGLIGKVIIMLQSRHHLLVLGTLRFLRSICALKDSFFTQELIKHNTIAAIVRCLLANGPRYNLLNSAIIEFFDFMRQEDMRTLIKVSIEKHWEELQHITYVKVFKNLKNRYEQHQEKGPVRNDSLKENQEMNKAAKERLFDDDDQWFSQDDDDQEQNTVPSSQPSFSGVGAPPARKTAVEPSFPSVMRNRFGEEDDEEDGAVFSSSLLSQKKPNMIRILPSPNRSPNSTANAGAERSRSPSSAQNSGVEEVSSSNGSATIKLPNSPVSTALKTLSEYGDSDSDEDDVSSGSSSREGEVSSTSRDDEGSSPSPSAEDPATPENPLKRRRTESPNGQSSPNEAEHAMTTLLAKEPLEKKARASPSPPPVGVATKFVQSPTVTVKDSAAAPKTD
ncbi:unnamed protein product, partial [Mesorhabditis spiculigera]